MSIFIKRKEEKKQNKIVENNVENKKVNLEDLNIEEFFVDIAGKVKNPFR